MSGDVHVRFCESLRGRFPRATRLLIFVRSKRAATRVMRSVTGFVTKKLRLKVNEEKSQITHPWWMCFLGFSFTSKRSDTRIRIHSKSLKRFKNRVRELTDRNCGKSIHGWIMRRFRAILWKQWKNPRTRVRELRKRGISRHLAVSVENARKGVWRMSRVKWVIIALPNAYFRRNLKLFLPGVHLLS